MPTTPPHRPYFASFLAAFRARSSPTASATSLNTTKTPATSSLSHQTAAGATSTTPGPTHPRSIASSTKPGATTAALREIHSPRSGGSSPLSTSPGQTTSHLSPSRYSPGPSSAAQSQAAAAAAAAAARRRGSDSSSDGFRDVLGGGEKWYIGGRTAGGEERFFKLGVVRRERSVDRLSLDRLSL